MAEDVEVAKAPGITQWVPLPYGAFRTFLRDPLAFLLEAQKRFGDVFRFRVGPVLTHFLFHPDHVRHVLHDQQKNYLRGWHYRLLQRLLGENLVVSEGDYWMRQRRLAQPAFLRARLAGYVAAMVDATSRMLARWHGIAAAGKAIDIGAEMSRLALAIAGRTLFSRDISSDADAVGQTFSIISGYLVRRIHHPFTSLPSWVPTPTNLRFQRAARTLNEIVLGLIRDRRREGRDHGDLLSMLLQARDEDTGAAMSDEQLRSEVLTFLLAGHETTATALTWTWYFLASHAPVQERVRQEVIAVLSGRLPTLADVLHLDSARMVIEEVMRLCPPIYAVTRQVVRDDAIGGYHIPARSTVVLCPFVTHRHPEFWEHPGVFDPERFTAERAAQRAKGAYFPFLSGPHQCIGNEFAMLEMRLIVAMVLRDFDVALLPGPSIQPRRSLTLRPGGPVQTSLQSRGKADAQYQPAEPSATADGPPQQSPVRV
jgi:cytochrome P450